MCSEHVSRWWYAWTIWEKETYYGDSLYSTNKLRWVRDIYGHPQRPLSSLSFSLSLPLSFCSCFCSRTCWWLDKLLLIESEWLSFAVIFNTLFTNQEVAICINLPCLGKAAVTCCITFWDQYLYNYYLITVVDHTKGNVYIFHCDLIFVITLVKQLETYNQ